MANKKLLASVAIVTYNGEEFLEEVLNGVAAQKTDFDFELIVIDSSSTDRTPEILERRLKDFPHHQYLQIPQKEFGHGKTRNLAVERAEGQFVAFLTQDATPAGPYWLADLIRPMLLSEAVVGVIGRQHPRPDCCPINKQDVIGTFAGLGNGLGITLYEKNVHITTQAQRDHVRFYSDANSALRKPADGSAPYRDVNYAEDQAYGEDLIAAGKIKAYTPFATVVHSHNYPLAVYRQRIYDEFLGLKKLGQPIPQLGLLETAKLVVKGTLKDWRFIVRDRDYSRRAKLKWAVLTPLYNYHRWTTVRSVGRAT